MREGAAEEAKNMSYSYGYVARMNGSENARQERRIIEDKTFDTKPIFNGKLTLIETSLKGREKENKAWLAGKSQIVPIVGGFTQKKFFLIGVGKNNKVEFEALISIVEGQPNGKHKCLQEVLEEQLANKESVMQSSKDKFKNSGFYWADDGKRLTMGGQFAFGNCAKEFFKNKNNTTLKVVDKLKKGKSGIQIGLQELNVAGGMSIAVMVGVKKTSEEPKEIIAPGILIKNNTTGGRTLWAGLQGDAKVSKTGIQQDVGQGTVVLHDWKSSETENSTKSLYRVEGQERHKSQAFAKKIELSEGRKYYLWDPSYTEIKNGKLVTVDGQEIPWETNIQLPFKAELVK